MSNDDRLRLAFAELSRLAAPREDCPDSGALFDAATGSVAGERFDATVEHTVGCGACAEAWRLARTLSEERKQVDEPLRAASRRFVWLSLAAAVVIVAAALPIMLRWSSQTASPEWRRLGQVEIRSLQPEDQPLPRERFVLRWSEPAPGARYWVTVGTERLETLAASGPLDRAEFTVPESALAPLPAGSKLLWRVEARLADGRMVSSPTFIAILP